MIQFKTLIFLLFLVIVACQSSGLLHVEGTVNTSLKEVSAAEIIANSNLIWTIEDAGNSNTLIALNTRGKIVNKITITNAENRDWEDLTSDSLGNIYIGDFGNNTKTRKRFKIYKIRNEDLINSTALAEIIEFKLPTGMAIKDFEAFFLYKNGFYIMSKEPSNFVILKVPNKIGKHTAQVWANYNFKTSDNSKITSADISVDHKRVVLLNHDKLWLLTNFKNDDFFSGNIIPYHFKHKSQKEGICFKSDSIVIITDERKNKKGGTIYSLKL